MNWILVLIYILIVIYLVNRQVNKRKLIKLREFLIKNWGKPKENTYFNFFSIGKYFENNIHKDSAYYIISDKEKDDLDIDDLFMFIDRTTSKIGQQFLYFKLRTIESIEKLRLFDKLVNVFVKDSDLRLSCQLILSHLNSDSSYDLEILVNDKPIERPKNMKFIYGLSLLSVISLLLSFYNLLFLLFLIPVFFINLVIHYRNKENVTYYISAVSQLSTALKVGKELIVFDKIRSHFTDFSFINRVDGIMQKTKFITFEKRMDNEFAALFWVVSELVKIQFNIETIMFTRFVDSIVKERKSIDQLFRFIGEVDSAISTASLKAGNQTVCTPDFVQEKYLKVSEIYHPLIDECITNDLELKGKSLLLTGSNMSGKTTFIRMLAINSILAQTIYLSFAKEYTAPFFKVHSSIRITDDLLDQTSYYLKEVLIVKEMIEASDKEDTCLFVLDEIFKGTNTLERISAGKAILSYLNCKNHFVAVSTHDIELTDLLEKDNYNLYHFTEKVEEDELLFDHKLKKGRLLTRNAIKILELYNYPSKIIKEARRTEKEILVENISSFKS